MNSCELLEKCGFFSRHKQNRELARKVYCQGGKQNECLRKKYRQEHGEPPSADMMPDGGMLQ